MKRSWLDTSRYLRSSDWGDGKSWHDTIWLLVPLLAILITGPVWFFRLIDLQMGGLTWSLFAFALLRELSLFFVKRLKNDFTILAVTFTGDLLGICLLGLLWHFAQSVADPLFLTVLLVPIIASALLYSSVVTYTLGGLAIAAVAVVAWIDVPQFRNAFLQMAFIPGWLAAAISFPGNEASVNSATDYSAANAISILIAFGFGCIVIAAIADRLCLHFIDTLKRRSSDPDTVVEDRRPTLLINRDTWRITSANNALRNYCVDDTSESSVLALPDSSGNQAQAINGPPLFDLIQFDEESEVKRIIAGRGGMTLCHYHVGPEVRLGRVQIQILADGEQCQIILEDLSAELYLRTTLDTLDQGVILLASNKVVLYFNAAARRLFPALINGVEAASALKVETLGSPWWDLGERSRNNRLIGINGRNYHTSCAAAKLPVQELPVYVISLSEA